MASPLPTVSWSSPDLTARNRFERVYPHIHKQILGFAYAFMNEDWVRAEEAVATAARRVWFWVTTDRWEWDGDERVARCKLFAAMKKILRYLERDYVRRVKQKPAPLDVDPSADDENLALLFEDDVLPEFLRLLDAEDREILRLTYVQKLSDEIIRVRLKRETVEAVRSLRHRSKLRLRELLVACDPRWAELRSRPTRPAPMTETIAESP